MINIHIKKTCRLCGSKEINKLFTLCKSPLANNLANSVKTSIFLKKIPLVLMFCAECNHIQLQHVVNKKHLFSNYFYMTGISNQFRIHFKKYSEKVIKKLNKQNQAKVFEIGSNDCTLLDFFKKKKCITVGVEPALNLYKKTKKNHEIFNCFYNSILNKKLVAKYQKFDLILANNVFAHIDYLTTVFKLIKKLMHKQSMIIFEVSYLSDVVKKKLFDTIYHEHLDYHALYPLISFFKKLNLKIIDVDKNLMHGGSIRVYIALCESKRKSSSKKINRLIDIEKEDKLFDQKTFLNFYNDLIVQKEYITSFFKKKLKNENVYGYGASAKGVTLINFFNLNEQNMQLIIDDSPLKQNKYIPGTSIKIYNSKILLSKPPTYIIILAWNVYKDILKKIKPFKEIKYVLIPLPKFKIIKL